MDFAANAVAEMIAPPARATNAKPAPVDDASQPSFDDHLDAAQADEAPAATPDTAPKTETSETKAAPDTIVSPDAPPPIAQQQHPEPAAAPVIVQLIAAEAPAPQPAIPTTAPAPQAAPETNPAATPLAGAPRPAEQTQPQATPTSDADTQDKSMPASKAAPQQQQGSIEQSAANVVADAAPVVTPAPAPSAQSLSAPAEHALQAGAIAPTTPQPTPQPKDAAQRTGKMAAPELEQTEAPPADAPVQVSAPKAQGAKNAPAPTSAKDNGAPTPVPAEPTPATLTPASPAAAQTSAQPVQHAALEQSAVRAAPAASQVAHEIVRRFNGESTRFELRLDPPELGRVDVRLEVSRDHRVNAIVSADSPQALTELARHARELEQTLQSAGLELGDNGLSFDLRQGRENAREAKDGQASGFAGAAGEEVAQEPAVTARPLGFERWRGVRVDVMA